MSRREIREHVIKMLYCSGFYEEQEMEEQISMYIDKVLMPVSQRDYFIKRYKEVKEKLSQIDEIISEKSVGWSIARMAKIDLNILRLAVYEIKFDDSIPVKVSIDEAVEIAKVYGGDSSPSFINGILAKVLD